MPGNNEITYEQNDICGRSVAISNHYVSVITQFHSKSKWNNPIYQTHCSRYLVLVPPGHKELLDTVTHTHLWYEM